MNNIWYHGSPRKFEKFELGHKASSRLPFDDCIAFTKSYKLATYFGENVYTVNLLPSKYSKEYYIYDTDGLNPILCIKVYNLEIIHII